MADSKISELDAVTTIADTDEYVLERAGASKKITGANLKSEAGGSQSGVAEFAFAFDDAGLEDGVVFYTPTAQDVAAGLWLLDAWPQIDIGFDGTNPFADIGTFDGETTGLLVGNSVNGCWDLIDPSTVIAGFLTQGEDYDLASLSASAGAASSDGAKTQTAPVRIISTDPLKLVVSQNGEAGGDPIGGTTGSGILCYRIGKP